MGRRARLSPEEEAPAKPFAVARQPLQVWGPKMHPLTHLLLASAARTGAGRRGGQGGRRRDGQAACVDFEQGATLWKWRWGLEDAFVSLL
jgi:hypothetical protein